MEPCQELNQIGVSPKPSASHNLLKLQDCPSTTDKTHLRLHYHECQCDKLSTWYCSICPAYVHKGTKEYLPKAFCGSKTGRACWSRHLEQHWKDSKVRQLHKHFLSISCKWKIATIPTACSSILVKNTYLASYHM